VAFWSPSAGGVTIAVRLTPKGGRDAIDGVETLADGSTVLKVRVRGIRCLRVPHAVQRAAMHRRCGTPVAFLNKKPGSRFSSASFHAAPRPGHER